MLKMINFEKIRTFTRKIYESCSEIRVNQEELEDMITAIDKLNVEYKKGRISKDTFSANEKRLKKESQKIIKNINSLIISSIKTIELINKEISSQKVIKDDYDGNRKSKHK
jgi:allophanate hydrolase subunit 1